MTETEKGYEDIYSSEPYFDVEVDQPRALLHTLYVPPSLRGQGKGKELFQKLLESLPSDVEYIRLKSATLGSGCTMPFWASLGFTPAYSGGDPDDEGRILHRAVNGFALPPVEALEDGETRHYIFD